jgi:ketosteroid isomerase-like protein
MSSANLDLVRSIYAGWERGDWSAPPTWADPEIEFVLADGPDPVSTTGVAEMVEAFTKGFLPAWDQMRTEVEEYRELDGERILAYVQNRGHGRGSGIDISQVMGTGEGANLWVLRDLLVVKIAIYWDRARALADLGLADGGGA